MDYLGEFFSQVKYLYSPNGLLIAIVYQLIIVKIAGYRVVSEERERSLWLASSYRQLQMVNFRFTPQSTRSTDVIYNATFCLLMVPKESTTLMS